MTGKSLLSARLREAIDRTGIKQKTLAKAVGVSANSLSRYLMDDRAPSRPVVYALARELHVSPDWLLGNTQETLADPPGVQETAGSYIPDAVALTGLDADDRQTVVRLLDALRSGDGEIRRHLIGQLKIIEQALYARRNKPREERRDAS